MKKPNTAKRGPFVLERRNELIICTLGNPSCPESEHIFSVHESLVPELIAGLTALSHKIAE